MANSSVKLLVVMVMMMMMAGFSMASVHIVGGDAGFGWTRRRNMGDGYYQDWAANKNFYVGDVLVFNYFPQINQHHYISYSDDSYHTVIQVTKDDFESCNATSPMATYNDGFDEIVLNRPGHYYFICDYLDHCLGGQKLHIMVTTPASPIASPTAAPYDQPSVNSASSLYSSQLWWLIMGVLALLCLY